MKNYSVPIWALYVFALGFLVPLVSFRLMATFLKYDKEEMIYFSKQTSPANLLSVSVDKELISMVFVGDIMLGRAVESSVKNHGNGDYSFLFENTSFLKEADIAFGNLEGPAANGGRDIGNLYSFRFNPAVLPVLSDAGFDVLSLANNHMGDWGEEAFVETIYNISKEDFYGIGAGINEKEAAKVKILKWKGTSFGFLGFSDVGPNWLEAGENEPGILIVRDDSYSEYIKDAAKKADVLIISIHFGEEYQSNANVRQKYLAHLAIDSGAKIVVGHHPHVIQEVEKYNGGLIAYSLGNFIFDQNFSEETMEGLALEVYLEGDELISAQKRKIKINQFYQPELVEP